MEKVFEEEITTIDLMETTRSAALSNDLTEKITATIAGAAKSPFYEVSANIGAALEQTMRSSIAESIRASNTVSRRERRSFRVRQTIKPGAPELQLAVAGYRKYRRDVYLHYIDYLFVEYRRTAFGLRRKKRNLPRPVGTAHINLIPIHIPLFRLSYWSLEPESSLLYTETEYQNLTKVAHPDRVTFDELHEPFVCPCPLARSSRRCIHFPTSPFLCAGSTARVRGRGRNWRRSRWRKPRVLPGGTSMDRGGKIKRPDCRHNSTHPRG